MRKFTGKTPSGPILFLVISFIVLCSLAATAQTPHHDWVGDNQPPWDKPASASITAVASDGATITFTASNSFLAGETVSIPMSHGACGFAAQPRVCAIFTVASATPTQFTANVPAGFPVFTTTSVSLTASQANLDPNTLLPGKTYGADTSCMSCHSIPDDIYDATHLWTPAPGLLETDPAQANLSVGSVGYAATSPRDPNGYIMSGHKKVLRKVLPSTYTPTITVTGTYTTGTSCTTSTDCSGITGQPFQSGAATCNTSNKCAYPVADAVTGPGPWTDPTNNLYPTLDAYGSGSIFDWTAGTINVAGTGDIRPLFYIFGGWENGASQLNSIYQGGLTGEQWGIDNYDCARCHATGYRFDGLGPEPTRYTGTFNATTKKWNSTAGLYTPISDADFSRAPTNGACSANSDTTTYNSYADCVAAGGAWPTSSWFETGITCNRCHGVSEPGWQDANGVMHEGAPYQPVGEQATALCMQCHREEDNPTLPAPGQTLGAINISQVPGTVLDGGACSDGVSDYAHCVAPATWNFVPFIDHESGTTFLNSPHARYNGTIALNKQNSVDLSLVFNGAYNSYFTNQGQGIESAAGGGYELGAPDPTKNGGCTGCHNPHYSIANPATAPGFPDSWPAPGPFNKPLGHNCIDCHAEHAQAVAHPTGPGTPFPNGYGDFQSCVVCHMQGANGLPTNHWFRITADPNYYTFPTAAQLYAGQTSPNTMPASDGYAEVWQDVDIACGQCHTGGNGVNPYGIIPPEPQPGALAPVAYSRAFLAQKAVAMHNTQAAPPTLDPAPGSFLSGSLPLSVNVSSVAGTDIYYTTDDSIPAVTVTAYGTYAPAGTTIKCSSNPCSLAVTGTEAIFAIAAGEGTWAYQPSNSNGGMYSFQVLAKPTFSPSAGNYTTASASVQLSGPFGATLYYTTDSTTPTFPVTGTTTQYTGPILLNSYTVLKAIATASGYLPSAVATSGAYTFTLATPTFSNVGAKYPGSYSLAANGGSITVKLNDATATATVCYTTNGTTPTATNGVCGAGSTSLVPGGTFTLTTPGLIYVKAIAAKPGYSNSRTVSGTYSLY